MHVQFRVPGAKQLQRRHHFGQRVLHRGSDAQRALEFGVFTARLVNRQPRFFEHAQAAYIKTFARLGQRQPPGVANEQSHPEFSLQAFDVEADHGPGLAQQISGCGQ